MKKRHRSHEPSIRALKVGERMRHVLASLFQGGLLSDPLLDSAMISVSEVRISNDLGHATAYIMPIGSDDAEQKAILAALRRHGKKIRAIVAKEVNTKYAAEIHFRIDESFAEGSRIDALLRSPQVTQDLSARPDGEQEES